MKKPVLVTPQLVCRALARNAENLSTSDGYLWLRVIQQAFDDMRAPSFRKDCVAFFVDGRLDAGSLNA